jgi:hypothetical protein
MFMVVASSRHLGGTQETAITAAVARVNAVERSPQAKATKKNGVRMVAHGL